MVERRPLWTAVLAVVWIGWWTLRPALGVVPPPWWCLRCTDDWVLGLLLNIALFAPLGAALAAAGQSPLRSLGISAGLSLAIELVQALALPGRGAALSDLLANTVGGGLAALLVSAARPGRPAPARWRHHFRWFGAGVVAVTTPFASLWLLAAAPTNVAWFGQPAPALAGYVPYSGQLLEATLDGLPLLPRLLPQWREHRQRMLRGEMVLAVRVLAGHPALGTTLIAQVADAEGHQIVAIGEDRLGYWATARTRSASAALRSPVVRVPRIDDSAPHIVIVRVPTDSLVLSVSTGAGLRSAAVPLSLASLWQLLNPATVAVAWRWLVDPLSVLVLGALIGLLVPPKARGRGWGILIGTAGVAAWASGSTLAIATMYGMGVGATALYRQRRQSTTTITA